MLHQHRRRPELNGSVQLADRRMKSRMVCPDGLEHIERSNRIVKQAGTRLLDCRQIMEQLKFCSGMLVFCTVRVVLKRVRVNNRYTVNNMNVCKRNNARQIHHK